MTTETIVWSNSTEGRRLALREVRNRPSNEFMLRGINDISMDEEQVILSGDNAIKYIKMFPGTLKVIECR